MNRKLLMDSSEKYHGEIHLFLGIVTALVAYTVTGADLLLLLIVSIIGAFLPDIDHIFYLFFYGRKSKYASEARSILLKQGVIKYIEYCKVNHKNNTEIKSHNVLVVLGLMGVSLYFGFVNDPIWLAFFISNTLHFVFDMAEDLLFFGKLNGNWWLKFGQRR